MYFHFVGASLVAQTVKNLPAMQETWVQSLGQEGPLENSMDGGAWQAAVHAVAKSRTRLSDSQTHTHTSFNPLAPIFPIYWRLELGLLSYVQV